MARIREGTYDVNIEGWKGQILIHDGEYPREVILDGRCIYVGFRYISDSFDYIVDPEWMRKNPNFRNAYVEVHFQLLN